MDVVYLHSAGSPGGCNEIRYSLRSLQKHLSGIDNVCIVGDDPGIFKNIIHIDYPNKHKYNRARNIYEKILRACQEDSLSDHFFYCSDDIYLLRDYEARCFPYYYCSTLPEMLKTISKENYYKQHVENTYNALIGRGLPTVYFNGHTPIVYHKELFKKVMAEYDWEIKKGYIAKSIYANTLRIPGEFMPDVKFHTPKTKTAIYRMLKGASIFSTSDDSINAEMNEVREELWPVASRWEL